MKSFNEIILKFKDEDQGTKLSAYENLSKAFALMRVSVTAKSVKGWSNRGLIPFEHWDVLIKICETRGWVLKYETLKRWRSKEMKRRREIRASGKT